MVLCSSVETGMLSSISELATMYNVNILGMVKKPELPITLIYNAITEFKGSRNISDEINDKNEKTESSSLLDIEEYGAQKRVLLDRTHPIQVEDSGSLSVEESPAQNAWLLP